MIYDLAIWVSSIKWPNWMHVCFQLWLLHGPEFKPRIGNTIRFLQQVSHQCSFVFLCCRYERPRVQSPQRAHLLLLPALFPRNVNVQVNVVTPRRTLLRFSAFLLFRFFSQICERCWVVVFFPLYFFFWEGGASYYFAVLDCGVWGGTRAKREVRHLINSKRLSFFFTQVWHFCRSQQCSISFCFCVWL